jgi:hypothetical protein
VPKLKELTREWRRLHNELHDLYPLQILLRGGEHAARIGKRRGSYRVLVGKLQGKNNVQDLDVDGRILLEWIFNKEDERHGLYRSGSRQGQVAKSYKCSNEPAGSIKYGEFPGSLKTS